MSSEPVPAVTVLLAGVPADEAAAIERQLAASQDARYRCVASAGTPESVAAASGAPVSLVIYAMPPAARGGLDAFTKVRTHCLRAPIVVLVPPQDEAAAAAAVQRGAQDYLLATHLDTPELTRAIRSAMDRHQLGHQIESLTRKLQASEVNFFTMIQNNADGMVIVDRHADICFVNPAAEALLGRTAKELLGSRFEWPLETGGARECAIVREGRTVRTAEMRMVETAWEGRPAYLASLRDISERKRVEQLKDEFVSKVSHELRTPLTSIKGAVALMLQGAMGAINEEQEDFLETINQDIDRLAGLINNVLDLSKIESGNMSLARQRVELPGLIEHAVRSHQSLLGPRKIERRLAPVPPVYADRNLVLQVLGNLLGNAIKFTQETGVITFDVRQDGALVRISVTDDGPGIPEEVQARLFQKFVQGEANGGEHPKGTGLGLAISREIVELHRGGIGVTSAPGQGCTFWFTLPSYEPVRTLRHTMEETAVTFKGDWALLLVDLAVAREAKNGRPAEELIAAFEAEVRKSIARNDHVALAEAELLGVVAHADAKGASSLRQRLRELCQRWWEPMVGRERAACIAVGTAVYVPQEEVDEVLKRARAAMTAPGDPLRHAND